ncbi:MAG: hypothetical protein K0B15_12325 [Lentimicrobium sp.]|nr:hypothetical protein [Lentimicrobium sp.]
MKKNIGFTAVVFIAIFLSSCTSTLNLVNSHSDVYIIDFRPYSNKGFLFTPEKYLSEYESIGQIDISFYPEALRIDPVTYGLPDKNSYLQGTWLIRKLDVDSLVNEVYKYADHMGADAIINFKVSSTSKIMDVSLDLPGISFTGFAIKRK